MASFASSATTCGARKHAWRTQAASAKKKKKKKVGENNGQLRFVRHHVWRSQARLDQLKMAGTKSTCGGLFLCTPKLVKSNICVNNSKLCL